MKTIPAKQSALAMPRDTYSSKAGFARRFNTLHAAAVGVVLVHAREPHRVCDALREWAYRKELPYREWDVVRGWTTFSDNPDIKPKSDGVTDATKALLAIPTLGKNSEIDGMFIMHYPHWILPRATQFIQCLKHYVREFSETHQRLVMIVPEGFQLPKELENDISIIDLELPTRVELREIYDRITTGSIPGATRELFEPDEVAQILSIGSGMTEMEFEVALSKALVINKEKLANLPLQDFCRVIRESKTEVVKRSEVLELMPSGSMDEVGGLDLLKAWIAKRRGCFSEEARAYGVDQPKGIALIGPPGTGKSVSAKAIAASLGLPLIRFDVGRVFNSLVGESEARVRSALKLMEAMSPCVAFIDEVDKAGIDPRGGGGDSGVGKRVMGAILTFMQETASPIFWIMTANRTENLPPEMLRKGRLDEIFSVQPPNETERLEVLKIHLRKRKKKVEDFTDLHLAVAASNNYVSAEIEAAVKDANLEAFASEGAVELTGELIAKQLRGMKPISVAFKEDFDAMAQWAIKNARPASSVEGGEDQPRARSRAVRQPRRTLTLAETEN